MPDRRHLIISRFGIAPPYAGNRGRMAALLDDLHFLGFELHVAGVDRSAEESRETLMAADRWSHGVVWREGGRYPLGFCRRRRFAAMGNRARWRSSQESQSAMGHRPLDDELSWLGSPKRAPFRRKVSTSGCWFLL